MVKDRPYCNTEARLAAVAAVAVFVASSVERAAVGARRPTVPAGLLKMSNAIFLGWEPLKNLYDVHGITFLFEAALISRQD